MPATQFIICNQPHFLSLPVKFSRAAVKLGPQICWLVLFLAQWDQNDPLHVQLNG